MPRSKKSGSDQPPTNPDPPNTDEGDPATMAHVSADHLAGSPDIFAGKRSSGSSVDEPAPEDTSSEAAGSDDGAAAGNLRAANRPAGAAGLER